MIGGEALLLSYWPMEGYQTKSACVEPTLVNLLYKAVLLKLFRLADPLFDFLTYLRWPRILYLGNQNS